jgi:hypothetical protein
MGWFITRSRPGDRELQERLLHEARRCIEDSIPTSEAVERILAIAGGSKRAFRHLPDGTDLQTDEGRAVVELLVLASTTREDRSRVRVRPLSFHRPTPREEALIDMPIAEAFDILAQEEPRLRTAEIETADAAAEARATGEGESGVRSAVREVVVRTILHDSCIGRSASDQSGLCATPSAGLIVIEHLNAVAGLSPLDRG